ncbi:lycopene beta-cyclase [Micromonospora phaseoli]|uniref:Lycopene beta-cyclase n=1 Tax=Micromonospora phaseoli TaxID=1144548 RepID=A0A1H7DXM4_9ACTN|nr:lycopene cyclase family protein [Micromonospora phaseoli]PZV88971.1 lycopene beta-cyclase [Micromonospora phaseoli]GIJ80965.1 lycopene cyclase [Micromonospora phaseoli]SEK06519.1 lycopene beta-cyclase [Micromonospora phaseoli]
MSSPPVDVDLALVGGGGAASLVLAALDRHDVRDLRIAVVDPVRRRGQDRTWAFWDHPGNDLDDLLSASWSQVEVVTAGGHRALELAPLRYAMLRSGPIYDRAAEAERRLGVTRIAAAADALDDDGDRVLVRTDADRPVLRARWVLDSRPRPPRRPGRTNWLQHFRGWWLTADRPVFDPGRAVLMDFRTPQPARGVSFGYVLPVDSRYALVEYTEFSPALLTGAAYDRALAGYRDLLGLDPARLTVTEVENGVIPMTDGPFVARPSPRVVRLGTAGGATRPSTGFTFSAMHRQAEQVARAVAAGRPPVPASAYPRRHRWMDAVALRALDRDLVGGPEFFGRLFDRNPAQRVLRFLDGATTVAEDLAVMRSTRLRPMVTATFADAAGRLRDRLAPSRRPIWTVPPPVVGADPPAVDVSGH